MKKLRRDTVAKMPPRIIANKPKNATKLKLYTAQKNPAKMNVNAVFASNIVEFLGVDKKIIVLDSEHGITCKTLIAAGIEPWLITPANMNLYICEALRPLRIRDYHGNIEDGVSMTRFDAAWYDGMTTMNGRKDLQTYIGLFAHRFLLTNHGRRCVMAITVNTQSNNTDCNYLPQKKMFERQIEALIAYHGFVVVGEPVVNPYKESHIFGMWNLVPATSAIHHPVLLTHLGSRRLVGFPEGFTFAQL